jgi:hypothetical protein
VLLAIIFIDCCVHAVADLAARRSGTTPHGAGVCHTRLKVAQAAVGLVRRLAGAGCDRAR